MSPHLWVIIPVVLGLQQVLAERHRADAAPVPILERVGATAP